MNDREKCRDCGKTWGVTMKPRESVLCEECARPKPWRRPEHYWLSRSWNFHSTKPYVITRSPEWWDQQTDLIELKYAAVTAASLES